jgi:hypothetical protein
MHRTRALSTLAFLLLGISVPAQDTPPPTPGPWTLQGTVGVNLAQSAFSEDWPGGDRGSWNWVLNGDMRAERQMVRRFHLGNQLQLAYGQTSTQQLDAGGKKRWSTPDKTTDLILFESTGRFQLDLWVEPYLSFRLDSQFLDESDPVGSLLFNPVKLTETGGIARVFHKSETRELISRLGFGFRQTSARSFVGGDPDEVERNMNKDGGFEFQTQAASPMWNGAITYVGKFLAFWPIFYGESETLETFDRLVAETFPEQEAIGDFWRTPDLNWQNTFTAQITKYLSVNLYLQLLYDRFDQATKITNSDPMTQADLDAALAGVRKDPQFKQTLALGVTYRLF